MSATERTEQGTSAISIDGRAFRFAGSLRAAFEPGGFVVLESESGMRQLGQVEEVAFAMGGALHGAGRILGVVSDNGSALDSGRLTPFGAAEIHPADARSVEALYEGSTGALPIGSYLAPDDVPARLLANRFNRHTFWCGQSGSGKTYALGVVLEQLLLHPPADGDLRPERRLRPAAASPTPATRQEARRSLADRDIRILRPSSPSPDSLRVRFVDLPVRARRPRGALGPARRS